MEIERAEIDQIIDFRFNDTKKMHELQIHWVDNRYSWEPLQEINKDAPALVNDFLKGQGLRPGDILAREAESHSFGRGRGFQQFNRFNNNQNPRGGRGNFRGNFTPTFNPPNGRGRAQPFGSTPTSSIASSQQSEEDFDPKKYKRMMRSKAADWKIRQWEKNPTTQSSNNNSFTSNSVNEPGELQSRTVSQIMMPPPPVPVNGQQLWQSSIVQNHKSASFHDFSREKRLSERQQKLEKAIELERQKKAIIEKREFVQRVEDQIPMDYCQRIEPLTMNLCYDDRASTEVGELEIQSISTSEDVPVLLRQGILSVDTVERVLQTWYDGSDDSFKEIVQWKQVAKSDICLIDSIISDGDAKHKDYLYAMIDYFEQTLQ